MASNIVSIALCALAENLPERVLRAAGHRTNCPDSLEAALGILAGPEVDAVVVVLDPAVEPQRHAVEQLVCVNRSVPVVAVGTRPDVDGVIDLFRRGVLDVVLMPFSREAFLRSVNRGIEQGRLRRDADVRASSNVPPEIAPQARSPLRGTSPAITVVNELISRVAKTPNTPVLITGESGTGKEVVAREIHRRSARSAHPMIKVNCAAIPKSLVEAELFGHEKGAFTDARDARTGLFELANGGTIFLDEFGDLDLSLQPKLLRVLEDKCLTRVGGTREIPVNVRTIAATNRDLEAMCLRGEMREDLYFRLSVVNIRLPALREHAEDILDLAHYFLLEKNQELGKRVTGFSPEVLEFFRRYEWPGNVRELRNMVERLIILSDSETIRVDAQTLHRFAFQSSVFFRVGGGLPPRPTAPPSALSTTPTYVLPPAAPPPPSPAPEEPLPLAEAEKRHILRVLERCSYNKSQAASALGISRTTMHRKLKDYGLESLMGSGDGGRDDQATAGGD